MTDSKNELIEIDRQHYLHPFANHHDLYNHGTHIIHSAKGVYVTDGTGKKLLDGLAGLWCVNVGYGRDEITNAVAEQMRTLPFYPSFFHSATEPTIRLAGRLTKLAPTRLTHAFFTGSGTESNETALKLLRAYYKLKKQPTKTKILTLSNAYHGVGIATTSMTRLATCQTPFDLPLPGFIQVPGPYHYGANTELDENAYGQWCLDQTEQIIKGEGSETIAALFVEPVQGAGGVIIHPQGYLLKLQEICRRNDIAFIADEVITGFGRIGDWFASKRWKLDPDMMILAKGITSGYFPMGAVLVSREFVEVLTQSGFYLAHGHTYSGHPVGCAAALANLDILEKEKLPERVRESIGPYLQRKLRELVGHRAVGEVRGTDLIGAIEILPKGGKAARSAQTPIGPKAMKLAREEGVIVRGIRDMIAIAPPLTIQESEVDFLVQAVRKALDRLWE